MPSKTPTRPDWEQLAQHYGGAQFIASDPVQFPHRCIDSDDWRDIELIGFIAAMFSYGRRDVIVSTVNQICPKLDGLPVETLLNLTPKQLKNRCAGFYYRFQKAHDLHFLLSRLQEIYQAHGSLKAFWGESYQLSNGDMRESIHRFKTRFLEETDLPNPDSYGLKFLLADPALGGTAKRFNMFLRWMVRQDAVDFGIWSDVTPASKLMMPVDTHVSKMARKFKITCRKTDNWQTVEEITDYFRRINPADPVRYDFALFGLGIEGAN